MRFEPDQHRRMRSSDAGWCAGDDLRGGPRCAHVASFARRVPMRKSLCFAPYGSGYGVAVNGRWRPERPETLMLNTPVPDGP